MRDDIKILLIEDNPGDLRLIQEMVWEVGDSLPCQMDHAGTLSDGLDRLSQRSYDAILLDLSLPDSQGIETLQRLRQAAPTANILVLTGYDSEQMAVQAVQEGAQDYLVKGAITGRSLLIKVHHAIERQQLVRDLDDQKQQLTESESRLRTVVDAYADGIVVLDQQELICFLNQAAESILSHAQDDLIGTAFPYEHDAHEPVQIHIAVSDVARQSIEIRTQEIIWEGAPAQLISLRDVTEQRILEERLNQSQKMEAVGQLAGGVAHDFNNLLTVINGYAQFIMGDTLDSSHTYMQANEILRAGQRAAELTRQLLIFSRHQVMEMTVFSLNDALDETALMLERLIGEHITLRLRRKSTFDSIRANRNQIEQVLINLAVNARDAIDAQRGAGGQLLIETDDAIINGDREVSHLDLPAGQYVTLSVSDNGQGMTEEVQEHLFEPFFTTKEVGKGTGLGLATVYGIIKQSRGQIHVYSEVGVGTTVRMYLPAVSTPNHAGANGSAEERMPVGKKTILVVEDDAGVRRLTVGMLKRLGYNILEARNGAEALKCCRQSDQPIDLVLTDVVMPEMSGFAFVNTLLGEQPNMRVLFMSGYTREAISQHGTLGPGMMVMQKPFEIKTLASKVREVLES